MPIHIVARDIQRQDAVGNFCRQIAALLSAAGEEVRLAAENCHPADRATIDRMPLAIQQFGAKDVVIFQFSTEDPVLAEVAQLPNPKLLYFHNITPERHFLPADPRTADLVRRGLAQRPLAARFDVLLANSKASARVLHEGLAPDDRKRIALSDIVVCPPLVGADRWMGIEPVPVPLPEVERLILFVGRLAPHKGIEDLLHGFAALAATDATVGLVVAGTATDDEYARRLRVLAEGFGPDTFRRVAFFPSIPDGALRFLYERAAVCASMSRHEGFGVPLLDAIAFGKPLVISAEDAMMETAGKAALVVTDMAPRQIAAALAAALNDRAVATRLAAARQRRLAAFRRLANGQLLVDAVARARRSRSLWTDQ